MTITTEPLRLTRLLRVFESAHVQFAAVIAAILVAGGPHWQNDGLWYQGDAPRHAANGFFYWDLLTAFPLHPLSYGLSYYARYPVISAGVYPPLFHIVEGAAFQLIAPSAYVAKVMVLMCTFVVGLYTLFWGRRWIAPIAGWAGACTILLPGFVLYSNVILLNIPAVALGLGALYHLHAWLDTAKPRDRALFVWLTVGAILTYYPGALVLPIAVAWTMCFRGRSSARFLWVLAALLVFVVLLTAIVLPAHFAREIPSLAKFTSSVNWIFYSRSLVASFGSAWCVLAVCGLAALATNAHRRESAGLAIAFLSAVVGLALLPARDERYALLLGPVVVLMAFVAIATAADVAGRWRGVVVTGSVGVIVMLATRSALSFAVPDVSGIDQVARYLRANGPSDSVLYSGMYDGVFGFYVRALDPRFERRVVLSNRLLYDYKQTIDFLWVATPHVTSPDDVISLIQGKSGCRWIAVEIGSESVLTPSDLLLRRTLEGPEFEHVRSFPVAAHPVRRIDLYRFTPVLAPAQPMDLEFPSFSARVFHAIEPIASRR